MKPVRFGDVCCTTPPRIIRRKHLFSAFLLDSLTLEDRMRLQDNVALTANRRNANKIAFSKYEWKRSHTGAGLNGGIRLKGTL
jgi:hypothetical protein